MKGRIRQNAGRAEADSCLGDKTTFIAGRGMMDRRAIVAIQSCNLLSLVAAGKSHAG